MLLGEVTKAFRLRLMYNGNVIVDLPGHNVGFYYTAHTFVDFFIYTIIAFILILFSLVKVILLFIVRITVLGIIQRINAG